MDFAAKLFDTPFEWMDGDPARQDLVRAQRVDLPAGPLWGPLGPDGYLGLAASADPAAALLGRAADDPVAAGLAGRDAALLLAHEQTMARLRGLLAASPRPFTDLAAEVFADADGPSAGAALAALVSVGAKIRDSTGSPVLSARYHLFARATEGAFTCLAPGSPHVSLARHEVCPDCSGAAFEFGCCKRCGAVHLAGSVERGSGGERFTSRAVRPDRRTWLLLDAPAETADEDDEILDRAATATATAKDAMLCGHCGALQPVTAATGVAPCGCPAAGLRPVRRLAAKSGTPNGCLACGARGTGMVRLLESGNEAAAAVLATALYQALPPDEELAGRPGGGRKLLTFSDSRQAAAFFAPYLESSHALVQQRRLIMDGLARATARDADATVDDLIEETAAAARRAGVFSRRESRQGRRREAARWVLRELVALDERQSLEGLGLLRVGLGADPSWRPPGPLLDLGLSAQECLLLLTELLRTVRLQGALTMPEEVDPATRCSNRGVARSTSAATAPRRGSGVSWLPTRGVNKRLDYLRHSGRGRRARLRDGRARHAGGLLAGALRGAGRLAARDGAAPAGPGHQVDHTWLTLSTAAVTYGGVHCAGGSPRPRCAGCARPWAAPASWCPAAPTTMVTTAPCTGRSRRCRWSPASTSRSGPAWRPPTSSSDSSPARSTC